jgi:Ser-tRNA(Ala) deacylase AlaX
MATKLIYLDDFGVVTGSSQVISINNAEDARTDVVLEETCFYSRGGGQDWDTGMVNDDGGAKFQVEEVRLDENGVVHHIGQFLVGELKPGAAVKCEVDTGRRTINANLHSAGHVVDLAVDRLGLSWEPIRGAHYPHMSFVEYEGEANLEERETIRSQIQENVNEVIASASENEIRFMQVTEMHTVCRHVPIDIPTNKPARVVIYNGDYGIPCGGTHVRKLDEIGKVTITKVKCKKRHHKNLV